MISNILQELFEQGVNFTSQIDFNISHTTDTVRWVHLTPITTHYLFCAGSVFETTIRYLAGSLSAYELSGKKYPVLVQKAKQVADKMSVAWVGVR